MANHFDLIVIGGGSGGIAAAKRSAPYGKKVAVIEGGPYGGTCVNVGCVPKKVMYNASHTRETIEEAHNFGFGVEKLTFDWTKLKQYRDTYIGRLNQIYESGLEKLNITRIKGYASFASANSIVVEGQTYTADHIVIAVGGKPNALGVPGDEYAIDSDGFFRLEQQPKKAAIIGAGYIAVELAGVLNGLGTDTSLFVRKTKALRTFDDMVSDHLDETMKKAGVKINPDSNLEKIEKAADGTYTMYLKNGQVHSGFDVILAATGRHPNTSNLNLEAAGVELTSRGHINVDEFQNTSAAGVYALGDVCGKVELTPMAIAAGRRLSDRLFNNMPESKADYTLVPTVVFSHPTIGTIGMTEEAARKQFPAEELKVYTSTFVNLQYGTFFQGGAGDKPLSKFKVICQGANEKVIGLHAIGLGCDELLQGFGIAMKMGATKADFDNCVAIHPTASEELVTLQPWGLSGKK